MFFQSKYALGAGEAQILNSLIYTISAVASPVFGFLIDRSGRNLIWTNAAILFTIRTFEYNKIKHKQMQIIKQNKTKLKWNK